MVWPEVVPVTTTKRRNFRWDLNSSGLCRPGAGATKHEKGALGKKAHPFGAGRFCRNYGYGAFGAQI